MITLNGYLSIGKVNKEIGNHKDNSYKDPLAVKIKICYYKKQQQIERNIDNNEKTSGERKLKFPLAHRSCLLVSARTFPWFSYLRDLALIVLENKQNNERTSKRRTNILENAGACA